MVHFPKHTHIMASVTQDQVIIRIDSLVSELKFEGFPVNHIIEEMQEYLNIHYELVNE